jgi:hypothetical protein
MHSTGITIRILFGVGRSSRSALGWLFVIEPT